jgi:hypothetical protein
VALRTFVRGPDGILFEIELPKNAAAVDITGYSQHPEEKEVLIAASSEFHMQSVRKLRWGGCLIPKVKLCYSRHWTDLI